MASYKEHKESNKTKIKDIETNTILCNSERPDEKVAIRSLTSQLLVFSVTPFKIDQNKK